MDLESDRFQRLRYSEDDFRTEAGAILGEYNLNFSNPVSLLRERLYDLAYTTHPYKHTTIGLLDDIRDMPNHYDYSLAVLRPLLPARELLPGGGGRLRPGRSRTARPRVLRRLGARRLRTRHPGRAAPDRGARGPGDLAEPDAPVPDDGLPRAGVLGSAHRHAGPRRAVAGALLGDLAALPQALPGGAGGRRAAGRRRRQPRRAAVHDHRAHHRPGSASTSCAMRSSPRSSG